MRRHLSSPPESHRSRLSRRALLICAVSLSLAVVCVPAATALLAHHVNPRSGRTYKGGFTGGGVPKVVYLTVSKSGHSADAYMTCNGPRFGGHIHMKIVKGAFHGKHVLKGLVSSLTIWSIKGHFKSKSTARAYVGLPDNCDGHGGLVTLTIT